MARSRTRSVARREDTACACWIFQHWMMDDPPYPDANADPALAAENLGKRLARSSKLYLNDSGLLAHLAGIEADGLARRPADLGPVAETFVVME